MQMTKKDRVFLINQYEILKMLDKPNSSHYENLIEILQNGYEIFYSEIDQWISDDMPSEEGKLVLDILDFYRCVEDYKTNNPDDEEITKNILSTFRGFDGNNETEYMLFVRFLIDKQGKFSEQIANQQKTDNFNSHMQMLPTYRAMVEKWRENGRNYISEKPKLLEILNVER